MGFTQHADGHETHDVRCYILNRYLSDRRFSETIGGKWGIKSMHWVFGVNFAKTTAAHTIGRRATI